MKRILKHLGAILLLAGTAAADQLIYVGETTAAERRIPIYLVDATDGVTEETGVAITGSECRISKNGAASADCAGSVAENETGLYYYEATTGEINTVGYITVRISDAEARKFIGKAQITAVDFSSGEGFIPARGTAQSVTGTTIRLAASESFGDDELNQNTEVHIVSASTGAGQTRCITDYVAATDTATVEAWQTTPTGTITYSLKGAAHCDGRLSATGIAEVTAGTEIAGTAQGGGSGNIQLAAGASSTNDLYKGRWVCITSATGVGQCRLIYRYIGSTKRAFVTPPFVTAPDNTSVYKIKESGDVNIAERRD